jgi:hypothetical protein
MIGSRIPANRPCGLRDANREVHPAEIAGWCRGGVPGLVLTPMIKLTCRYPRRAGGGASSSVVAMFNGYYDFALRVSFREVTESFRYAA